MIILISLFIFGITLTPIHAQEILSIKTDQIKVAYLANFVKFTTWTNNSQKDTSKPLQIMVIGDDPFLKLLQQGFPNNQINRRPVVFHTLNNIQNSENFTETKKEIIRHCHIVYLRKGSPLDIINLSKLNTKTPFLFIGDLTLFAEKGGMIGFRESHSKISFDVNTHVIHSSSIQVSSKLLRIGTQVKSKK